MPVSQQKDEHSSTLSLCGWLNRLFLFSGLFGFAGWELLLTPHTERFDGKASKHERVQNTIVDERSEKVHHGPSVDTSVPLSQQCEQFRDYWQTHCDGSTQGLIRDEISGQLRVDISAGKWHQMREIRQSILSQHKSDDEQKAGRLLNTFSYYDHGWAIHQFLDIHFRCSKPSFRRAFKAAQRVWLPFPCRVPVSAYSADLEHPRTLPLLPDHYTLAVIGNSYLNQITSSIQIRSHIRDELERFHPIKLFKEKNDGTLEMKESLQFLDLTRNWTDSKSRISLIRASISITRFRNDARLFSIHNHESLCLSEERLLSLVIDALMKDEYQQHSSLNSSSSIDMLLVNPGNRNVRGRRINEICEAKLQNIDELFNMSHEINTFPGLINLDRMHQALLNINNGISWMSAPRLYSLSKSKKSLKFTFNFPWMIKSNDKELRCASDEKNDSDCYPGGGHQCMPGNPDSMSEALSINAYLHHCHAHRWLH